MKEADISKEIRKAYEQSPISITLWPDRTVKNFGGLAAMYNFFEGEIAFWTRLHEIKQIARIRTIQGQVSRIWGYLQNLCTAKSLSTQNQSEMQSIRSLLAQSGDVKIIYSTSSAVQSLVKLCSSGRYDELYITNYITYLQNEKFSDHNLQGQFAGYMALNPLSDPAENLELKSHLEEVINKTQSILNTTEQEQSEYWDTVKGDYDKVTTEITSKYEDFYTQRQQEQEKQAESWAVNLIEAQDRLADLENLYQEKLRLEAPATYWEKLEKEYIKKAKYG